MAKILKREPCLLFAWLSKQGGIYRRAGSKNWLTFETTVRQCEPVHKAYAQRNEGEQERVHEQVLAAARWLTRLGQSIEHIRVCQVNQHHY